MGSIRTSVSLPREIDLALRRGVEEGKLLSVSDGLREGARMLIERYSIKVPA